VIVDDDASFLKVAQTLLESDGVTVAGVANTCAEAVQRVEALRPDVVLIDIRLGQESGFDAARQLAAGGPSATLIMVSTYAEADYADLIAESPVTGFLPKAELSAAAIRRILGWTDDPGQLRWHGPSGPASWMVPGSLSPHGGTATDRANTPPGARALIRCS
jgi:CheY-like chemotaxis protein